MPTMYGPFFKLRPHLAAARSGLKVARIRQLAKDQVIGALWLGGKLLGVTTADLDKWVAENVTEDEEGA